MKTLTVKLKDIERKWYLIDAKDKILGHLSTFIADKLRGKNKPIYSPHMDCGDFVIVINADKVKLTANKEDKKMYYRHSGYIGNLKEEPAKELRKRHPTKLIELAVTGMLPRNKLRKDLLKKLKLYAGENHPHTAQNPEKLETEN